MTDWDRVERLRAKGWDWDSIAEDPKVKFAPPEGSGSPGRVLKSLYLKRRSRGKKEGSPSRGAEDSSGGSPRRNLKGWLFPLGVLFAIAGGIWIAIAFSYPLAAQLLPPVPGILLVVIVGLALLGASFITGAATGSGHSNWHKAVAAGIALGLVLSAGAAVWAVSEGIPNLTASTTSEVGGYEHASNPMWKSGGLPVFFFYGSVACPFCSASSWAVRGALEQFGNLSGWGYLSSNPNDVYPNTPEVDLSSSSLASSYITWIPAEGANNQQITEPPLTPVENAYVTTYDSGGGIPFYVIGGVYIHAGTLISPAVFSPSGSALSYQQVEQDIQSQSGPVYQAVLNAQNYLEAYLAVACKDAGITPPASVTSNSAVVSIMNQIS